MAGKPVFPVSGQLFALRRRPFARCVAIFVLVTRLMEIKK
jgi:hypothetical protein